MSFIVYGKSPKCKRFSPLGKTCLVNRLIHAVTCENKEFFDIKCKELNEDNPGWQFEVRKK